ncbi:MAG: hypothetical protein ACI4TJ_08640 [Candidatus Cryptobacteroides sp.]
MKRALLLLLLLPLLFLAVISCTKEEPLQEQLEVNRNNISGQWELVEWNGKPLEEGSFFRIDFVRNDATFTISQNFDAFPSLAREITGTYALKTDDWYRPVITGMYDHDAGMWSHEYLVVSLTSGTMKWIASDDASFVQSFRRLEQ